MLQIPQKDKKVMKEIQEAIFVFNEFALKAKRFKCLFIKESEIKWRH
tara:strand:+ start:621 stop:761 length:141 start_codon:yes stop_codon:yes gene_type:complete